MGENALRERERGNGNYCPIVYVVSMKSAETLAAQKLTACMRVVGPFEVRVGHAEKSF